MAVKGYKPKTPSLRTTVTPDFSDITSSSPQRSLTKGKAKSGGRNNLGRMTARHRGGGHKRRIREVDFRRNKDGVPARVVSIEYDPNRSAHIALLVYADGERRYILAPDGLKVDDRVASGLEADVRVGNCMPLLRIPPGVPVHNIELIPGRGGQLVRSAGGEAQLMGRERGYAQLRLPSGEIRLVRQECRATVGAVSNSDHRSTSMGKAGRARWLGRRPHVRGVAMNPVDHPLGGGEGKSSGGRHPTTPWGKPTKGAKTRKRSKSNRLIMRRRRS
jgi:large subunit ribosomal protein L2